MKRILALILALMMVLALAACGEKTSAPSGSKDNSGTNTPSTSGQGGTKAIEVENKVGLSLDKSTYEIDEHIAVTLDFSKLNQDAAIIVVVNSDTEHGKAVPYDDDKAWAEYRWLADFSEVPFYLYPKNTGNGLYDVRVYADAESGKELASITIAVGNAALPADSGNAGNTGTGNTPDDGGKGGVLTEGGDCTQKQMEDTIVSYLSKISDLSSLTLGGGSRIQYDKAGDALNDFDIWTIYDPTLDNNGMYETMNSQLTAAGFTYEKDMVGRHVWYIDDGGEHKGILFWPDDDEMPDGYYILMMTYVAN